MQNRVKSGTLLFYLYRHFYGPFLPCVKNILLEKEKATHSSSLAWRIPWTEEPGELSFIGLQSQTRMHPWGGGGRGNGFGMIQAHCTYCALYFYYYYISSTSDHQALDPGAWDSCFSSLPWGFCTWKIFICSLSLWKSLSHGSQVGVIWPLMEYMKTFLVLATWVVMYLIQGYD